MPNSGGVNNEIQNVYIAKNIFISQDILQDESQIVFQKYIINDDTDGTHLQFLHVLFNDDRRTLCSIS